jgi:hypothetical protein
MRNEFLAPVRYCQSHKMMTVLNLTVVALATNSIAAAPYEEFCS